MITILTFIQIINIIIAPIVLIYIAYTLNSIKKEL